MIMSKHVSVPALLRDEWRNLSLGPYLLNILRQEDLKFKYMARLSNSVRFAIYYNLKVWVA